MQRTIYTLPMRLPDLIKHARQEKKMTVRELARRVGVSAGTISRWESGENVPASDKLSRLGLALGLDPRTLDAAIREQEAEEEETQFINFKGLNEEERKRAMRIIDAVMDQMRREAEERQKRQKSPKS